MCLLVCLSVAGAREGGDLFGVIVDALPSAAHITARWHRCVVWVLPPISDSVEQQRRRCPRIAAHISTGLSAGEAADLAHANCLRKEIAIWLLQHRLHTLAGLHERTIHVCVGGVGAPHLCAARVSPAPAALGVQCKLRAANDSDAYVPTQSRDDHIGAMEVRVRPAARRSSYIGEAAPRRPPCRCGVLAAASLGTARDAATASATAATPRNCGLDLSHQHLFCRAQSGRALGRYGFGAAGCCY